MQIIMYCGDFPTKFRHNIPFSSFRDEVPLCRQGHGSESPQAEQNQRGNFGFALAVPRTPVTANDYQISISEVSERK